MNFKHHNYLSFGSFVRIFGWEAIIKETYFLTDCYFLNTLVEKSIMYNIGRAAKAHINGEVFVG